MDPQQENNQRRRGVIDRVNDLAGKARQIKAWVDRARMAYQAAQAAIAAIGSGAWIPIVIGIAVVLIIIIIVLISGGGGGFSTPGLAQDGTNGGDGTPGGSGSILSCSFYRDGEPVYTFGNPEMARFVDEVSSKVGVPAGVVAGIMRVESGSKLALTDPSYFAGDYDAVSSGVAWGLMQFTPGTFVGTFNNNASEMNSLFGKTSATTIIDPPNKMAPDSVLRIYSIRDSIIATAFKVKRDKQSINGDGPYDQPTVYEIARRYYGCLRYGQGGCTSGPYNYGEDVWKSYSECKSTAPIGLNVSCPIDANGNSAYITCGTAANPRNNCGHGGLGYPACTAPPYAVCPFSNQLKNSIDVVSSAGVGANLPVYLPKIAGKTVEWQFTGSSDLGSSMGWRQAYDGQADGQNIILELTHVTESDPIPGTRGPFVSGTRVATTYPPQAHLHIGVLINGVPVDPITNLSMCTGN